MNSRKAYNNSLDRQISHRLFDYTLPRRLEYVRAQSICEYPSHMDEARMHGLSTTTAPMAHHHTMPVIFKVITTRNYICMYDQDKIRSVYAVCFQFDFGSWRPPRYKNLTIKSEIMIIWWRVFFLLFRVLFCCRCFSCNAWEYECTESKYTFMHRACLHALQWDEIDLIISAPLISWMRWMDRSVMVMCGLPTFVIEKKIATLNALWLIENYKMQRLVLWALQPSSSVAHLRFRYDSSFSWFRIWLLI